MQYVSSPTSPRGNKTTKTTQNGNSWITHQTAHLPLRILNTTVARAPHTHQTWRVKKTTINGEEFGKKQRTHNNNNQCQRNQKQNKKPRIPTPGWENRHSPHHRNKNEKRRPNLNKGIQMDRETKNRQQRRWCRNPRFRNDSQQHNRKQQLGRPRTIRIKMDQDWMQTTEHSSGSLLRTPRKWKSGKSKGNL